MSIGPVQLIVLGFDPPNLHDEIITEVDRLRELDDIRVVDAIAVYKDIVGAIETKHVSKRSGTEATEFGSVIGALIGLGIEGDEGFVRGAVAGAQAASDNGLQLLDNDDVWDVLADIPDDSAAVLLLIEHHWAVPLRDAVMRAGGFRLGDEFIRPSDLVAVGLVTADEAAVLAGVEESVKPWVPLRRSPTTASRAKGEA